MKLGFIGYGVVGKATHLMAKFSGYEDCKIYDPPLGHYDSMKDCKIVFVSVPVPTESNGEQYQNYLFQALNMCDSETHIFIRSSVLPGTVDQLKVYDGTNSERRYRRVYALPEFLTERTANEDAKKLPLIASAAGAQILSNIFTNKSIIILQTERDCEFVKYMHNAFCAMKVGFFNTMYKFAEGSMNFKECVDAACAVTGFIEPTHTKVPGPDRAYGFGGKCLPKDLLAFCTQIEEKLGPTFLRQVLDENFYHRFGRLF